jgi:hypothetical protein
MTQFEQASHNLDRFFTLIFAFQFTFAIASFAYLITSLIAHWQNLRDNRGIDRLTWLFAICLPFGFIFFWLLRNQGQNPTIQSTPNYTPPPQTPEDIAAAISADLAKNKRSRA